MGIDKIISANEMFVNGIGSLYKKNYTDLSWIVVCCSDERLMGFINKAMGFRRGEAVFIQNAGNTITKFDNSVIRSIILTILKKDVTHIAVVGHSDCHCKMGVSEFVTKMQKKNIELPYESDYREYFGLINNERQNIRNTVMQIALNKSLPANVKIYGLFCDINNGKLELVCEDKTSSGMKDGNLNKTPLSKKYVRSISTKELKSSKEFLKQVHAEADKIGLEDKLKEFNIKIGPQKDIRTNREEHSNTKTENVLNDHFITDKEGANKLINQLKKISASQKHGGLNKDKSKLSKNKIRKYIYKRDKD